jgi:predicted component of type VI protein secretion system
VLSLRYKKLLNFFKEEELMKKIIAVIAAVTMAAMTIVGCGKSSDTAKTAKVIDIDLTDEEYAFGVDKDQPEPIVLVKYRHTRRFY